MIFGSRASISAASVHGKFRLPARGHTDFKKFDPDYKLDELISTGRIKAFRRSSGWVIIGHDALRGEGGQYSGPERRVKGKRTCITCPDMVVGKCVSMVCDDRHREIKHQG